MSRPVSYRGPRSYGLGAHRWPAETVEGETVTIVRVETPSPGQTVYHTDDGRRFTRGPRLKLVRIPDND